MSIFNSLFVGTNIWNKIKFVSNVYILMDKVNFMNLTRCEYWRLGKSEWGDWVLKIGAQVGIQERDL
jgi:hypothetical protein